jgi:hypothetical protein
MLASAVAVMFACSSGPAGEDEAGTTTSPDGSAADEGTTSIATAGEVESPFGASDSSSDDEAFVDVLDVGGADGPCDPFAQDCPEGEKCVPYVASGDHWNAVKCVPILGDKVSGESCTYPDSFQSTDDCNGTSFCLGNDGVGEGVCRPFCTGSIQMPECPEMMSCTYSSEVFLDTVINICLPTCNPLAQDCGGNDGCYWIGSDFVCLAQAGDTPIGEPCTAINECGKGSICTSPVPDCASWACCTNLCDLGLGDEPCTDLPGTTCQPFHEQGLALPDFEHVGACLEPF